MGVIGPCDVNLAGKFRTLLTTTVVLEQSFVENSFAFVMSNYPFTPEKPGPHHL